MPDDEEHQHATNGNTTNGNTENGSGPQYESKANGPRRRMAAIIEDFTFLWFTVSMNTGILSILMHQLPYQFRGLGILSTILFVFNIVLFAIFFIILLLRIALYPKTVIRSVTTNVTECAMMGAPVIAWLTITAQVGLTASQASWGGHAWFLVSYVFWWIGTACTISVAFSVMVIISKQDMVNVEDASPALVIPFVATATDAVVGGLIVSYSHFVNARLAVPVIIVSYMLTGIGVFAALMVYAVYLARLLNAGLPPMAQSPTLILLVGPLGQSSAALQGLGSAAVKYFGTYNKGTFLMSSAGSVCSAVGVLLGLMLLGMAIFWVVFGTYVILEGAIKRQHKYSLAWWGTLFPIATVNTATIEFSISMDSPAFRGISAALLIILVINYLVNWAFTLRDIFQGKLLNGSRSESPASDRVKEQ